MGKIICLDAVEVHAAGKSAGIEVNAVKAGTLALLDERGCFLPSHNSMYLQAAFEKSYFMDCYGFVWRECEVEGGVEVLLPLASASTFIGK